MTLNQRTLAYAGALPFIFCALLFAMGVKTLPIIGSLDALISTYALLIASFMAGINWGQGLSPQTEPTKNLPLISNAIALAAWGGFLVLPFTPMMIFFALLFAAQLFVDWTLLRRAEDMRSYLRTRLGVTTLVIMCLVISALRSV